MNIFEKVLVELGWQNDATLPRAEMEMAIALPEDEATGYSIAYLQQLFFKTLIYKQYGDESSEWATFWGDSHRQFRNALAKHCAAFDCRFYDKWAASQHYPNEFMVGA